MTLGLADAFRRATGLHNSMARTWARICFIGMLLVAFIAVIAPMQPSGATGWTSTYTAVETIPVPPASSYQGSGGGDGWAVALSSTAVYNVFHHAGSLTVACHLQSNALPCWNPETISDATGGGFATSGHPGLWLDQSSGKLYVYATRTADSTGGVVCVDTTQAASVSNPFCGFTALAGIGESPLSGYSLLSAPALVGTRWYSFNYSPGTTATGTANHLLCFDIGTLSPCVAQPFVVGFGGAPVSGHTPSPVVAAIGNQVVIPVSAGGADLLACFNGASEAACGGTWPVTIPTGSVGSNGAPFAMTDSSGVIVGVCLPTGTDLCLDQTGAQTTTPTAMPGVITGSDPWNGPAFVLGPRVYVPNGNANRVECFDYSKNAACTNFPLTLQNLGYLYTVNPDPQRPTCIWANADNGTGQIQNFDAYTGGPCGQGPIRVLAASLVAPSTLCTPYSYTSLQVLSPPPTSYTSGSVAFQDGDGNPLSVPEQMLDNTGTAALAGLNLNTNVGLPQFLITLSGSQGTPTSVDVRLTWTGVTDPSCGSPVINTEYVALGDSYSSGEGAPAGTPPQFISGTDTDGPPKDRCHRSTNAYSVVLNNSGAIPGQLSFHACSGALVQDFYGPNHDSSDAGETNAQISWLDASAKYVTLSVGGNDAHFADVMSCFVGRAVGSPSCEGQWEPKVAAGISMLASKKTSEEFSLRNLFRTITRKAPNARVIVLGYPRFFPNDPPHSCPTGALYTSFSHADMKWVNDKIALADSAIAGAAKATGVTFVNTYDAFDGHELCTSDPWLNHALFGGFNRQQQSFHPTAAGQAAFANAVGAILP